MSSSEIRSFQDELLGCLETVDATGSFATSLSYTTIPNPCLDIEGYGTIGLPLSQHDAQAIIQRSRQAPFGKGEETLVDTSVRKTWEIDASKLTIKNPAWAGFFDLVLRMVVQNLGVEGGAEHVRAEPYKLLLYEEGCIFKPHRDTEKLPGMIATLVLSLPSKHSGGVVQVSHGGETKELDTASNSEFNLTALAWYADVKHGVSPIRSGYRLVLTYNLIMEHSDIPGQSAERLDDRRAILPKVLHKWPHTAPDIEKFVFILDHQYTPSSLNMIMLKGRDAVVAKNLRDACSSADVYLFLAHLHHETDSSSDFGEYEDEYDSNTFLNNVMTLDGKKIGDNVDISQEIILQEDPFPDDEADSQDEEEFTGNEAIPGQLRYHKSVIVLVHQTHLAWFLSSLSTSPNAIDWICSEAEASRENDNMKIQVARYLKIKLSLQKRFDTHSSASMFHNDDNVATILKWCFKLRLQSVLQEWLATVEIGIPSRVFQLLAKHIANDISQAVDDWNNWFKSILFRHSSFPGSIREIDVFKQALIAEAGNESALVQSFLSSARELVEGKLATVHKRADCYNWASSLVVFADWMGTDWLMKKLVPFVKAIDSAIFTAEFLIELKNLRPTCIHEAAIRETFQILLVEKSFGLTDSVRRTTPFSYATHMADLLGDCLALNLHGEAKVVMNQIVTYSSEHNFDSAFLIDLIRNLNARLQILSNIDMQDFSILFEVLLKKLISQTYEEKPDKPNVWYMKPRGCGCTDCKGLDLFLTNSTQKHTTFIMAQQRRRHLQDRLPNNGCYATATDKRGSPHGLIVKKVRPIAEYEEDHRKWQAKFSSMQNGLAELRGPFMKRMLGSSYEDLIELRYLDTNCKLDDVVKILLSAGMSTSSEMSDAVLRDVSNPPSSTNIPPDTGVKRKAEDQLSREEGKVQIIDLSDD